MTRHRNNQVLRKQTKKAAKNKDQNKTTGFMEPENFRILPTGDFCFLNPQVTLDDGKKVEIMCNSFGATNAQIEATVNAAANKPL